MNNFEKGKKLEDKTADRLDAGIESSSLPRVPGDGGIDISGEATSHEFAIQCKNWANKIGRNVVEELAGVLSRREKPWKNRYRGGALRIFYPEQRKPDGCMGLY
ncbi:2480_t:CDS:2 [Funneliformis mosseae]|uniref:2480_t:CDS:1 n=1 Tax=Funneliformis mosseae TaxID=27381 RepID=A0A9N9HIK3_FUNMO|nr:2480_t:CDS:2 [Funneliformis mosseae]